MEWKLASFLLCSLPDNQKPINSYIEMKENPFLNWIFLSAQKYAIQIAKFLLLFLFISLGACIGIFGKKNLLGISLSILGSISLTIILIALIGFQWFGIMERFQQSQILYEESSWFDSQIWEKPYFLLKNDRLIRKQRIFPFAKRSAKIFCVFLVIYIFSIFVLGSTLPY